MMLRKEIIKSVVEQTFRVDGNGDTKVVLSTLLQPGFRFGFNQITLDDGSVVKYCFILLEKSVGVARYHEKHKCDAFNPVNVHCLQALGIHNFGWGGKNVIDWFEVARETNLPPPAWSKISKKTIGAKAPPALSMFWLFRWSLSIFFQHQTEKKFSMPMFAEMYVRVALQRPYAKPVLDGQKRKRENDRLMMIRTMQQIAQPQETCQEVEEEVDREAEQEEVSLFRNECFGETGNETGNETETDGSDIGSPASSFSDFSISSPTCEIRAQMESFSVDDFPEDIFSGVEGRIDLDDDWFLD